MTCAAAIVPSLATDLPFARAADAIALVRRRIAGALAGSAPKGAIVCNPGFLGRPA